MSARSPRYPVPPFRVLFDDGRGSMSGSVADVSESGLFIETDRDLPPGTRIRIRPTLAAQTGIEALDATVVRKGGDDHARVGRPAGVGVRFGEVDGDTLFALRKVFERATWSKP